MATVIDTTDWFIGSPHVTAKGAKTCYVNPTEAGGTLILTSPEPCRAAFPPSCFDKDPLVTRLNLDLRISPEFEEQLRSIDEWMIAYLTEHSERIFKRVMTRAQVAEVYHPLLKTSERYPTLLRTKMNTAGKGAVNYWGPDGATCREPEVWRDAELTPRLWLSHLWIMGTGCGLVCNVTDLMVVEEPPRSSPFGVN